MASHNLLTVRETILAKLKLRTRWTTLIVKSRSILSSRFKSLNQQPLRTAFSLSLTNASLVRGINLVPLLDLPDLALNQIALLQIVSVPEFLRNGDPTFPSHIDRKDDLRFTVIRHHLQLRDNTSFFHLIRHISPFLSDHYKKHYELWISSNPSSRPQIVRNLLPSSHPNFTSQTLSCDARVSLVIRFN
jgi:hypothetical protein